MSFVSVSSPVAGTGATPALPASATSQWVTLTGLGLAIATAAAVAMTGLHPVVGALALMTAYAVAVIALEVGVQKVHHRSSTGLDWSAGAARSFDWGRIGIKYLGLMASLGAVGFVHWLLRFYSVADMALVGSVALALLPLLAALAIPYFAYVDRAMTAPHDGFWHLGQLVRGRTGSVDWLVLREHALGWTIKGFFLPIMFVYLVKNIGSLHASIGQLGAGLVPAVGWLTTFTVVLELTIVCVGYLCTLRAVDAHIRSPNPLLVGWLVTLACYEPFNQVVSGQILDYRSGPEWGEWLGGVPALAAIWALLLLASFAAWLWATSCYGVRWSNLTNRGIITNGPYRFTRHPDYVSKSIFFWLIGVPFLSTTGPVAALQATLLLICVNLIYLGRAKVEERHLSEDPDYVAYALAMNERSIFRGVGRLIPALRYRPPQAPSQRANQ